MTKTITYAEYAEYLTKQPYSEGHNRLMSLSEDTRLGVMCELSELKEMAYRDFVYRIVYGSTLPNIPNMLKVEKETLERIERQIKIDRLNQHDPTLKVYDVIAFELSRDTVSVKDFKERLEKEGISQKFYDKVMWIDMVLSKPDWRHTLDKELKRLYNLK